MALRRWIAMVALAAMLLGVLPACVLPGKSSPEPAAETEPEYQNTYSGYKDYEIGTYERLRAKDLLENYGFTDYTEEGNKRHYYYTAEDFRTMEELDETYLYALYVICDGETFSAFLEALGYEDLSDYLIRMDYVDSDGEPSLLVWCIADMEQISQIMVEKTREQE